MESFKKIYYETTLRIGEKWNASPKNLSQSVCKEICMHITIFQSQIQFSRLFSKRNMYVYISKIFMPRTILIKLATKVVTPNRKRRRLYKLQYICIYK